MASCRSRNNLGRPPMCSANLWPERPERLHGLPREHAAVELRLGDNPREAGERLRRLLRPP
eukprot:1814564-Lingulodinium_polyedra.AAC.1